MKKTKRTFTRSEKISYCVDKIQNLSDKGLDILSILIDNNPKLSCNKIVDIYKKGWKPVNRSTQLYWLQRGWNEEISVIKCYKSFNTVKKRGNSPFSILYWENRTNLKTGNFYSKEEADYETKIRRPICKEYWENKGYSLEESIELSIKTKKQNNIKGASSSKKRTSLQKKAGSKRCIEYWLNKNFTKEQAIELVSIQQNTFSLIKCIKNYGLEEGYKKWIERQEKWQSTLNSKSIYEQIDIIRKKGDWKNRIGPYTLYIVKYPTDNDEYIKIGITATSLHIRFGNNSNVIPIQLYEFDNFNRAKFVESEMLKKYQNWLQTTEYFNGYSECFIKSIPLEQLKEDITFAMHNI